MAIQIDKHALRSTPNLSAAEVQHAPHNVRQPDSDAPSNRSANAAAKVDYARIVARHVSTGDRAPSSMNMLGVCHLRLGNFAEAVRIYRALVLQPGCTWERSDVPAVYKRNFATSLLLFGLPAGCLSVLQSLGESDTLRTRQLFAAIKRWERSLTFLQRWDWRLNGVAPKDCQIAIDFEPGEFE